MIWLLLQAFQYMAENYANMNEIIDVVEGKRCKN